MNSPALLPLDPAKFRDPARTAKGDPRATVALGDLRTLWLNTGTLCNIACEGCYIGSSPRNDRLAYLTRADARGYLDEIVRSRLPTREIGLTGGEPFMNPDAIGIIEDALDAGFRVLVLTNAMKPMERWKPDLLRLRTVGPDRLALRVSLDHYGPERHEEIRGPRTWAPAIEGLFWLALNGFDVRVATRLTGGEYDAETRVGFARLFATLGVAIYAGDPLALVCFPEMDVAADVPEISTACWGILGKSPSDVMCASSRMVVKRRGALAPAVVACTLLPYEPEFELGPTLASAARPISLNHPHCARFCVLGGASCSAG